MEGPAAITAGFGHLPDEIQEKVFAFAVESKWRRSTENTTDGRNDRLVLQCDGLSLTSKGLRSLWSSIIWRAHPKSVVSVLAAEGKVKLLHKIDGLLTIKVFARHDAIAVDLLTFQQSLLGNSDGMPPVALVSRFPALQKLSLNPITEGVANFKKLWNDDLVKAGRYGGSMLFKFVVNGAKEIDVVYCPLPRQQYNLDLLGEKSGGLVLECYQFPLPQPLDFDGISLIQCHELECDNAKIVKASKIKSFQSNYFGLEQGKCVGNHFSKTSLACLPCTLQKLVLRGATQFQLPHKFPRLALTSLELSGCSWKAGNASNCLPAGLTSLEISFDGRAEDSPKYVYSNFSLAGLPTTLLTLKIDCKKPLVGHLNCPQLKTLVTSRLPPSLPASLTSLTLDCSEPVVGPLNCPQLKTLVIKGKGGIPSLLPATLTLLTLTRPDKLSLLALAASCPALEQLSLHLERDYEHGPYDNLPPILEGDFTGLASLREVRCSDEDFLAALKALPHNRVDFVHLQEEDESCED